MNIFEMRSEVRNAKQTLDNADNVANEMAHILRGRLRKVSPYVLKALKKELRSFNAHTQSWKD